MVSPAQARGPSPGPGQVKGVFVDVNVQRAGPGNQSLDLHGQVWVGLSVSTELSEMRVYHLFFSVFQNFYFQFNVAFEERVRQRA